MKAMKYCIFLILLPSLLCCDGLFDISPIFDNPFDIENDLYAEGVPDIPRDELLAEYLFTGSIEDSSGNGNDCSGSPGNYTTDRHGDANSCLYFNGSEDYLIIPETDFGRVSGTSRITISLWFKALISEGTLLSFSRYSDTDDGWEVRIDLGSYSNYELNFAFSDHVEEIGYNIIDEKWHHLIIMSVTDWVSFQIDGSTAAFCSSTDITDGEADDLYYYIGAGRTNASSEENITGAFFVGYIDDIRIYNRSLSQEEIYALLLEGLN